MSDEKPLSRAWGYLAFLPGLVELARTHGYALAVHGSLQRDFDLVACPWVEDAASAEDLAEAIRQHVGGIFSHTKDPATVHTDQPHGRKSWAIHLAARDLYVDISIMPRAIP